MTRKTLTLDDNLYNYLLDVGVREAPLLRELREETGLGIRPRDLFLHDLEQLAAHCEALAPAPSPPASPRRTA